MRITSIPRGIYDTRSFVAMSVTDGTWSGIGGRMAKSCETCQFFQFGNHYSEDGECHRNPPEWVELGLGIWPRVVESDWCGEYKQNSVVTVLPYDYWDR